MAVTNFTPLLGLALPTTGDLNGTWGQTVNDAITTLLDTAVAGTTTLNTDADVTLSTTNGATNQARAAIILWTASGTVTRNITAPAQSKAYVVVNATGGTQSIVIRGVGPTTGVTIVAGEKALVAWNGSDFVKVSSSIANLASVTGTLATANGGTNGTATPTAGALAYGTGTAYGFTSAGTSGQLLQSNGTGAPTWTTINFNGLSGMQVFTSNGTFTVPASKTVVKVTVVGGGGGGGGASSAAAGGGGGGGTAIGYLTGLTPGLTISVTVGAGGAAGDPLGVLNGSSGGTSSVSSGTQTISTISATGGGGGTGNSGGGTCNGGAGGAGSGGNLQISGSSGFAGYGNNGFVCTGGGSYLGGAVFNGAGQYGGGGSGRTGGFGSGTAGAAGVVIFEY